MKVLCFGAATQDVFLKIDPRDVRFLPDPETHAEMMAFEHDAKIGVTESWWEIGGGAINTAAAYTKLGIEAIPIVAVGDDFGGEIIHRKLDELSIPDGRVITVQGQQSGISAIISTEKGDRTALVHRGANDFLTPERVNFLHELNDVTWISLSHLSGQSDNLHEIIFSYARERKINVAWNPGSTQIRRGLSSLASFFPYLAFLCINRREAEMLTGRPSGTAREELHDMARDILVSGVKCVVISDGDRGAVAANQSTFWSCNTFPSEKTNTTGAGDAFFAGFVVGLEHSEGSVDVALTYASVNAASVISRQGGQRGLLTIDEIRNRIVAEKSFHITQKAL